MISRKLNFYSLFGYNLKTKILAFGCNKIMKYADDNGNWEEKKGDGGSNNEVGGKCGAVEMKIIA
jgi:hypothetical protein